MSRFVRLMIPTMVWLAFAMGSTLSATGQTSTATGRPFDPMRADEMRAQMRQRVLLWGVVIGAGVAGLQAIASAKRMGAVVSAYDVRPAVAEQIESLGGKFVHMELDAGQSEDKGGYAKAMDEEFYRKQRELMTRVVAENDVVITTAAIPGKKSPVLITEEMLKGTRMVIVLSSVTAVGPSAP